MDALGGGLDNVPLRVFSMKEEDYVMMLISTYSKNEWFGEENFCTIGGESTTFKYPETLSLSSLKLASVTP